MKDLLLDKNGDLVFTNGDVSFTDSVVQAITVRLRWFLGEWKINTDFGVPYYDDVFVKNPNKVLLEERIREEILSVEEVEEVSSVSINIDSNTRAATINFTAVANGTILEQEVDLNV